MLRVLIADDHAIVRRGLKEILRDRAEPTEVGEAGDGQTVLNMVSQYAWDVVVLDITMPRLSGLQVLRQLKRTRPELPVLMLSMHSSLPYIQQSLQLGAAGYLSKESAPEELLAAIDTVRRGRTYISRGLRGDLGDDPAHGNWGGGLVNFALRRA